MPRDDAAILDILKAANLALAFTGKLDKAAFLADLKPSRQSYTSCSCLEKRSSGSLMRFAPNIMGLPGVRSPACATYSFISTIMLISMKSGRLFLWTFQLSLPC